MTIYSVIGIFACIAEAGLIAFMAVNLLDAMGVYDDFKQGIVDRLDGLRRRLEEYTKDD